MSPMHFDRYTRDGCRRFYLIYEISRQNGTFSVNRDNLRYSEYSALQRSNVVLIGRDEILFYVRLD